MLNGLDLFSGIGGISLALKAWVLPVAYCEQDKYCQAVLCSGMSERELTHAPIWDDVRTLDGTAFKDVVEIDIISGGFPCQDISTAGNGAGLEGKRSGLFYEIIRLVSDLRPSFVFLENVPAITTRGGLDVISEFTKLGYDCRWTIVSAAEVGAVHERKRWFLLANSTSERLERLELHKRTRSSQPKPSSGLLFEDWRDAFGRSARKNNELPVPVDQVKALGNAVVPVQAREAFMRLMGLNNCKVSGGKASV